MQPTTKVFYSPTSAFEKLPSKPTPTRHLNKTFRRTITTSDKEFYACLERLGLALPTKAPEDCDKTNAISIQKKASQATTTTTANDIDTIFYNCIVDLNNK